MRFTLNFRCRAGADRARRRPRRRRAAPQSGGPADQRRVHSELAAGADGVPMSYVVNTRDDHGQVQKAERANPRRRRHRLKDWPQIGVIVAHSTTTRRSGDAPARRRFGGGGPVGGANEPSRAPRGPDARAGRTATAGSGALPAAAEGAWSGHRDPRGVRTVGT